MAVNEKFLKRWQPIHERGMIAYLKRDIIVFFILSTIIGIAFYFRSPENINSIIRSNLFIFILFTIIRVSDWLGKDKKYRKSKALSQGQEPTS